MLELALFAAIIAALLHLAQRRPTRRLPAHDPEIIRRCSFKELRRRHVDALRDHGPEHWKTRRYHAGLVDRLQGAKRHATR